MDPGGRKPPTTPLGTAQVLGLLCNLVKGLPPEFEHWNWIKSENRFVELPLHLWIEPVGKEAANYRFDRRAVDTQGHQG